MGRLNRDEAITRNAKICEARAEKKGHIPKRGVTDADALRAALAAHKRCYEKSILLSGRFDAAEAMHDAVRAWLAAKGLPYITDYTKSHGDTRSSGWEPFLTDSHGIVIKHRYDTIMELMRRGMSDEEICAKVKGLADVSAAAADGVPAIRVYRLAFEGRNYVLDDTEHPQGKSDLEKVLKRLKKYVEEDAWDY